MVQERASLRWPPRSGNECPDHASLQLPASQRARSPASQNRDRVKGGQEPAGQVPGTASGSSSRPPRWTSLPQWPRVPLPGRTPPALSSLPASHRAAT